MSISEPERSFMEEAGVVFEQTGLPRMAGRLFGWLLIADPPYQSPSDLAGALRASKGSISTSIRLLTQMGFIERHIIPGSRHDNFRLTNDAIKKIIRHGLEQEIRMFRTLADQGLELTKALPAKRKAWLKEMQIRYSYLEECFPALVAQYDREKNRL